MTTISVVIPTVERAETVRGLVESLLEQDHPDFEIVVVDQSEHPNEGLRDSADPRVVYVHTDRRGTCHARNLGVARARGDVVLFLDDDVLVESDALLRTHAENYADEKIGGVGGRVIDRDRELNREQAGPLLAVGWSGRIYPNATGTRRQLIEAPRGGHVSFRREIIRAVGGFDERFVGNAMREETDFSLRVVRAGHGIVFDPRVEVIHLALRSGGSRTTADRLDWYAEFFFNEALFFGKHFSPLLLPWLLARKLRAILACMFWYGRGRPRALTVPWRSLASGLRAGRAS